MSNSKQTLLNRRRFISRMNDCGYSKEEMARFFEVNIDSIQASLNKIEKTEEKDDDMYHFTIPIEDLLSWRDKMLSTRLAKGEDAENLLSEFGLIKMPTACRAGEEVRTSIMGLKTKIGCDYVEWLIENGKLQSYESIKTRREFVAQKGLNMQAFSEAYQTERFTARKLENASRACINMKDVCYALELLNCGFKPNEIRNSDRLKDLSDKDASEVVDSVMEHRERFDWNHPKETIEGKVLSENALFMDEFMELTGMRNTQARRLQDMTGYQTVSKHNGRFSMDKTDVKMTRRKKIFYLYNVEKMTQQEIADMMSLSRTTVGHEIQKYEREHPDEVDRSILWQQRNHATSKKTQMDFKREVADILLQENTEISLSELQRRAEISLVTIQRHFAEKGVMTPLQVKRYEQEKFITSEYASGKNVETIAHENGWSRRHVEAVLDRAGQELERAVELRYAYQMPATEHHGPTTMIMNELGKTRINVLNDQHKTSAKMRSDSAFARHVIQKKGDIVDEIPVIKKDHAMAAMPTGGVVLGKKTNKSLTEKTKNYDISEKDR